MEEENEEKGHEADENKNDDDESAITVDICACTEI